MLNRPPNKPFNEVCQVGAVIKQVEPEQRHVGFLYKLDNDPPRIVHLAWHNSLRHEEPTLDYSWVQCGFDEKTRNVIGPVLAEVAEQERLPYSPVYEGVYFEEGTLRYNRTAPGEGLTCATFMVEILERLGFSLFTRQEWQPRAEDAEWLERIIQRLEQSPEVLSEHTQAIRAKPQGIRFRPEEVAGSFTEPVSPVSFERAKTLGRQVLDELSIAISSLF